MRRAGKGCFARPDAAVAFAGRDRRTHNPARVPANRAEESVAYETILYEVADGVLTVTLNRPDRLNAFTSAMRRELIDAFDRADADDAVRAVIVTGAGRAFCAGADLSAGPDTFDPGEDPERVRDGGGRLSLRIFDC